jgi:outer membrane immunogenic protein
MEGKQYLVLLASILILSGYGTARAAAWNDDLRGENSPSNKSDSYFGLQYGMVTYSEDELSDLNPSVLIFRFGQHATENFSIEGRFGLGVADDSLDISGVNLSLEIDSVIGVYGVIHAGSSADSSLYALFGFTKVEVTGTVSAPGFQSESLTDSDSGASFGIGVELGNFNIEFTQYLSESTYDVTAISLGGTF